MSNDHTIKLLIIFLFIIGFALGRVTATETVDPEPLTVMKNLGIDQYCHYAYRCNAIEPDQLGESLVCDTPPTKED